ncbi:ABC transporter permease [Embleya sp. NBC_00888]|uniref:ABC transporter permease n=1 Tax=Embleya sp. NBC_00888 TaxID=2975960 RepID=UPI00386A08F0|nr:ABC transporter permease [Embleya sp. NBC_00888]
MSTFIRAGFAVLRPIFARLRAIPQPSRDVRPRLGPTLAALVLGLFVVAALMPDLIATRSPDATDPVSALQPPGGAHWFGTDQLGRDVFSRVVHGARASLSVGVGATLAATTAGVLLGLAAAFGGRVGDAVLMRALDTLLALPEMLVALLVVTIVGPGTGNVLLAIAVAGVPGYARMTRSRARIVRRADYVEAAVGSGVSRPALLLRHVLPNAIGPVLVLATIGTGTAIVSGAALSFLGLGPRPPASEWGAMLASGQDFLQIAWWTSVFPGAAIAATVMSITVLGRHLQTHHTKDTK